MRWTSLGLLATGGSATIRLASPADDEAHRLSGGRRVVLKRLHPHFVADVERVTAFLDEMRLMARLRHPSIVDVLDLEEDDESYFAVLELVDGPSVQALMRVCAARNLAVPVDAAVEVALGLATALHVVHSAVDDDGTPLQLVHRDVTPHNVLVDRAGPVKLTDFGVAKSERLRQQGLLATPATQPGTLKSKLSHLTPEQIQTPSRVDARSDLYGIGVCLHGLLTGTPLWSSSSDTALIDDILHTRPVGVGAIRADVDAGLAGLVGALLEKDPAARPATAAEVQDRSREWLKARGTPPAIPGLIASTGLPSLQT